ncbi:Isocitrate/isopropylmalate dehydrogenase [Actinopolyspora lacussalsi subsp. righensis]|uniref:Isocitrate/isopropylmalate dehydrogenase n=1 Tax=Actinopolyspora righensis TaxID=995060 RepID=A0A1I7AJZ6_9ACTN|nr:isocitrate/isopropylmalate family dehydrogenase [Actinopolyspora righensis]SFT75299.1 Isocitrate/isopropylmalate dehydrogenase [Actinopolyspora righensis]
MTSIAVLPGDGIGPEVTDAALDVLDKLDLPLEVRFGDIGWKFWQEEGDPVPERTWKLLEETDTCLLGAITSKPAREADAELSPALRGTGHTFVSPVVQLRQRLGLYANVRPVTDLAEGRFDFTVIRENTEGLYAGLDFHGLDESLWAVVGDHPNASVSGRRNTSATLRLQTRHGIDRILRFGFEHARAQGRRRLTLVDKPNVLRQSGNFLRERLESHAEEYPEIETEILNVDAVALWMVRRPERFQVLVAENMFGDILSDLGAGVMGGLGLAGSGNIGDRGSYFEPVHGSAPGMAGDSRANPTGTVLALAQLLRHVDMPVAAGDMADAVTRAVRSRRAVTYDLGGTATTEQAGAELVEQLRPFRWTKRKHGADPENELLERLGALDTAAVSDALDSMGVRGVLPGIAARVTGTRAAGLAYTVTYREVDADDTEYRDAANYLDEVPAGSVVVLDNQGSTSCTNWGSLLTTVAQRRGVHGTVVHGSARDVAEINELGYPLFSSGVTMVSGKNRVELAATGADVDIAGTTVRHGDVIVADDNGALRIPAEHLVETVERAERVERTESEIARGVTSGLRLDEARERYGYSRPWDERLKEQS